MQQAPRGIPVTRTRPGRIAIRTRAFSRIASTLSGTWARFETHARMFYSRKCALRRFSTVQDALTRNSRREHELGRTRPGVLRGARRARFIPSCVRAWRYCAVRDALTRSVVASTRPIVFGRCEKHTHDFSVSNTPPNVFRAVREGRTRLFRRVHALRKLERCETHARDFPVASSRSSGLCVRHQRVSCLRNYTR